MASGAGWVTTTTASVNSETTYPVPQGAKLREFCGVLRLFRPRCHVVDGGPDSALLSAGFPPLAGIAPALPCSLIDLLPVAAGRRRGHRVFYRLPLSCRRSNVDQANGFDPLGHT